MNPRHSARRYTPMTPAQHERLELGLYVTRLDNELEIVVAANLNGLNAGVLKRRVVDEIAAGMKVFVLDLSLCERIDRRGQEMLVSIKNMAARVGGRLRITTIHDRALEQLVAVELAHLFEPESNA